MRSPAVALTWQAWWRYRRGLAACAALWLVLAVVGLVLPTADWAEDPPTAAVTVALASFLVAFVFTLYAVSNTTDVQLEAREAGFPVRQLLLPVRTRALVGWPMLQAAAVAAVTWVAWAAAVLRPAGMPATLGWPALVTAATVVWLQALVWWPFPVRFLRIAALAIVLTAVAMLPPVGMAFGVPAAVWVGALAASLPAAYAVAVVGVGRARRGDATEWTWPARAARRAVSLLPRGGEPFPSPLRAQVWFEWRLRGAGLPFMVGITVFVWALVVLTGTGERAVENLMSDELPPVVVAAVGALTPLGYWVAGLLAVPPLMAGMAGVELGGTRFIGQRPMARACHPFIALRPLTDGELVRAKLRMAARATLAGWALVIVTVALVLTAGGRWRVLAAAPALQPYGGWAIAGGMVIGLAGLILYTWLALVSNLWVGLTGRAWFQTTVGLVLAFGWVPVVLAAVWLGRHPAALAAVVDALPYVAVAAVAVKLGLATRLGRTVVRRGMVRPRDVLFAAITWAAVAVGHVAVLSRIVPADWVPLNGLALAVALVLPLNRFAAMQMALAWNRHR